MNADIVVFSVVKKTVVVRHSKSLAPMTWRTHKTHQHAVVDSAIERVAKKTA
jgi:hypothetical protein